MSYRAFVRQPDGLIRPAAFDSVEIVKPSKVDDWFWFCDGEPTHYRTVSTPWMPFYGPSKLEWRRETGQPGPQFAWAVDA